MRIYTLMLLICLQQAVFSQGTLTETIGFGENPGNLKMFQFIPDTNFSPQRALVLVLHCCSQSAQNISDLTGWNKLAKIHDFIVVYPQQKITNNPNLCFNWFNQKDTDKGKGEVHSIYEMTRYAIRHWNIDTNRIYSVGFSAGAAMSVSLLAAYPEVFNGGASFAGTAYQLAQKPQEGIKAFIGNIDKTPEELRNLVLKQNPSFTGSYPRLVVFQGLGDKVVTPRNAYLLVEQWEKLYSENLTREKSQPVDTFQELHKTSYINEAGDDRIILYEVHNLGHKIVINPGDSDNQGGKEALFTLGRDFHSTYQTAVDLRIIEK